MSTSTVIIGNGMAGSRLAALLRERDPRCQLVIFGDEPGRAYNRILLSDVLAGKLDHDDIALAEPSGAIDLRTGVSVVEIDRVNRVVVADDGSRTRYDKLILATGSRALVPPIQGLRKPDGELVEGAITFRTMGDCRQIVQEAGNAKRAVVLGGGLLGLEAARGLARRGLAVDVVHLGGHLMERQLDSGASQILIDTLEELGVTIHLEAFTKEIVGTDRVESVLLENGTEIPADLLVVACGVRPETALAEQAGLQVERGVIVDDWMRTSDLRIYAIGDCAEHRGMVYGFVAPAWEQAQVVADVITGGATRYFGSRLVTRLKASGVDLASMGDPHSTAADDSSAEVLTFADPARRTYSKVVIRDRRLVGAIFLGDTPTVGLVTQLFDRGDLVPNDPRALLFPVSAGAGSPQSDVAEMSAGTTVCRCNTVTAGTIVRAWLEGARTVPEVASVTRATTGCGGCRGTVEEFLSYLAAETADVAGAVEAEEVVA
ncbi:FAD-dependent oxidoreductase [Flindersiella endophytica]